MLSFQQQFTPRQYMVTPDFEYFHYRDWSTMEVEYHNHDFFEIYYFISGKVTYIVEGKSYKLKPGDILLINNKELHKPAIESGEAYERIVIWVNPGFVAGQSAENSNLSMCFESAFHEKYRLLRTDAETQSIIKSILMKIEGACSNMGFGNGLLKNLYLTELLVFLNRAFLQTHEEDIETDIEYNEKIDYIIQYINKNLNSDLSLDSLSSELYISKYHLLRQFKKYTGYTIHRYIQQKRLILAKSLIKEGTQVTEVCVRCGFGDYSNFIRSFKKAFGTSPMKYRCAVLKIKN